MITDFPKIECPFVRKEYEVEMESFKKYGSEYKLRTPKAYLVVNEVNPGFEWVFEDKDTIATEKLDGTNVGLEVKDGRLVSLQNRKNVIDPLQIMKGKAFLIEGVFMAIQKGYVKDNAIQFGEIIGPKLQGNPLNIVSHLWYPFERCVKYLTYRSFHEHERTFDNLSSWFKDYLKSRLDSKKVGFEEAAMAEGVVFYNEIRRAKKERYRAKLRRDMFPWFYEKDIKIIGYPDKPL